MKYIVCVSTFMAALLLGATQTASAESPAQIVDESGIRGGLVVHLGCGDGTFTTGLRVNDRYLVHGLDTSAENILRARTLIQKKHLLGKVSVDLLRGETLPYVDKMVNLLIAEGLGNVSMDEVMRVLAPHGAALVKRGGRWEKTVKTRPDSLDDWTHYLHDPAGTMVGQDELVGPPRHIQWTGDPKWLRNHEFMSSMHAMVSSNGRIFYIMDEGLRTHIFMPPKWKLIARDAFNGTILWKRDIKDWQTHIWPMKSGPGHMPRRLVAIGDTVYVTLGFRQPVTAIDAINGETIHTYKGTASTEEMIVDNGILYLVTDPDKGPLGFTEATTSWGRARKRANTEWGWTREGPGRRVMAVDTASGKTLWQHETKIAPLTLTLGGGKVFYYDGVNMIARDSKTRTQAWTTPLSIKTTPATGYTHRLVYSDGILAFCHGRNVHALDAGSGDILWNEKLERTGHNSPNDMFIINGLVWSAATGKAQKNGTAFRALDLRTGEEKKNFVAANPEVYFMHQRCYPGRATERYIMTSGTGTEFYELGGPKVVDINHYVRGSCIYGIMPANGLIYKPADSCACHYQSKLTYMTALASGDFEMPSPATKTAPFEKGPAYGMKAGTSPTAGDWPEFRNNSARTGGTTSAVSDNLRKKWSVNIGGKLSAMTVAGGKAYVAEVDAHTVHALNTANGKTMWTYTSGGRIDSPPTVYGNMIFFGSADGWVYCLRSSDGELVWRYRAAPNDRKLLSRQQVESVWPVHGSVLVYNDTVYCLAGRNMFMDGGMRLVLLDVATGEKTSETLLNEIDPETGQNLQNRMPGKAMPVANPDILSCDGKYVYMGAQKFDLKGKRVDVEVVAGKEKDQSGDGRHLFCPTGFLDDAWFHRTYMLFGVTGGEGHGEYTSPPNITPAGRVLAHDTERVYGFRAAVYSNTMQPRPYHYLFSADKKSQRLSKKEMANIPKHGGGKGKVRYYWTVERPSLLANTLLLADDTIYMAGPPELADEEKGFGISFEEENPLTRSFREQADAWNGAKGAILLAVNKTTGASLAEYKLPHVPVFDGMAAAERSLFIPLMDGTVVCMGE